MSTQSSPILVAPRSHTELTGPEKEAFVVYYNERMKYKDIQAKLNLLDCKYQIKALMKEMGIPARTNRGKRVAVPEDLEALKLFHANEIDKINLQILARDIRFDQKDAGSVLVSGLNPLFKRKAILGALLDKYQDNEHQF